MPLQVAPMLESDMETFVRFMDIAYEAVIDYMFTQPLSAESNAGRADHYREELHQTNKYFLKVTDTDLDEIVACVKWSMHPEGRSYEEYERELEHPHWIPENNVEVMEAIFQTFVKDRREIMGDKPHWRMDAPSSLGLTDRRG